MTSTEDHSELPPGKARRRRRRKRAVVLVLLLLIGLLALRAIRPRKGHELSGTVRAPDGQSALTSWLANAEPAAWDAQANRVIINRRAADGLWEAYSIRPDGQDEVCLTCRTPTFAKVGAATNRGAFDVSPNGRYVLLTVEKGAHPGAIGAARDEPGKGVYNDIWLETIDGAHVWQLTDLPTTGNTGIIWPRFDRTGTQIVWAQMYGRATLAHPLGKWTMKLAHLVWSAGVPRLSGLRTYDPQPGRFYEPYGFSPDDQRILFASDLDVSGGLLSPSETNTQIWTLDAAHLDDLQRVSPPDPIGGMFSDYNEFGFYIPGTNRILIARTYHTGAHGLDYWTVNANGSDPRRVTFMNQPGNPEYLGYSQALGGVFDPENPRRFLAGVSHDIGTANVQAVWVTLGSSGL